MTGWKFNWIGYREIVSFAGLNNLRLILIFKNKLRMKIFFFPMMALVLFTSCQKDNLPLEDLESTLPGRWEIESVTINELYLESIFQGDTIQEDQVIRNIGTVEFPEFTADDLLLNSVVDTTLPFYVELDSEFFNFEIEYLTVSSERYFGAFRMKDDNNLDSEIGRFLETTLLFDQNSNLTISDQNTILVEPANGDHVIRLERI